MPVPRAAAAELCRIPLGLRPGPFSFPFQGGPSSYEEPPGALGTGPERAAVWGDRRCGGGSSKWGGASRERPLVSTARRLPPARPPRLLERRAAGAHRSAAPSPGPWARPLRAGLRALSTGRCPRSRSLGRVSVSFRRIKDYRADLGSLRQTLARRQAGQRTAVLSA